MRLSERIKLAWMILFNDKRIVIEKTIKKKETLEEQLLKQFNPVPKPPEEMPKTHLYIPKEPPTIER